MISSSLPVRIEKYLDGMNYSRKERKAQESAYFKIAQLIDDTKDAFAKRVYVEALEFTIEGEAMSLTYCFEQVLVDALKEHRAARKRVRPIELFDGVERILAGATYTANFGESRRYPLKTAGGAYMRAASIPRNTRSLTDTVLPEGLLHSYYQFGVHTFRVGRAVTAILKMIEERYDLDFQALEKELTVKKKQL